MVEGQGWLERNRAAVGVHAGTPGIGVDAAVRPGERIALRAAIGWIPYTYDVDEDDVSGRASPPGPIVRFTADLHPFGGPFHLSVGVHHYSGGVSGRATPREGIEFNDREYAPEELGELTARAWGRETAPFLGLGWQSRAGTVQPFLDLGVLLTGAPSVSIEVSGVLRDDPQFRSDLDAEIRELEDELSSVRVLPHLSVGIRFRIGGGS